MRSVGIWLIFGMLVTAGSARGQRVGTSLGNPAPSGRAGTPGGVEEKDELHGFHRAMALQATNEQMAQFVAMVNKTEAASRELDELKKSEAAAADEKHFADLRQAIAEARAEADRFVAGFSPAQKSGLKEEAAKLLKAAVELGDQEKTIEPGADARDDAARVAAHADALGKALANFRAQQESPAVEMSIVVPEGTEEVVFTVPAQKFSTKIAGQPVGVTTSAVITRPNNGSAGAYKVEATTDLADLQENIGTILAAAMNREERCGERIQIKEVEIDPDIPTVEAIARLHYERWACGAGYGMREIGEGNATVNVKLTPSIGPDGRLKISGEVEHGEAEPFLVDLLKTGALGDELSGKMAGAVAAAVPNLKTALPAAGDGAVARSVRYESLREGDVAVVVSGELQMSDEQAKAFAQQLKERAGATARKQ